MACCIYAAFLYAQFRAMLRRLAVCLGLAAALPGQPADTLYSRIFRLARHRLYAVPFWPQSGR